MEIVNSIFPEKFTIEQLQGRTTKVDFLYQLI